jgi:cytidylate kinase
MSKTLITLDGPSGVGKTTIGKRLASELNFEFFSSGLLYRVIALHNDKTNSFNLNEFEIISNDPVVCRVDGKVYEEDNLYTAHINTKSSEIAQLSEIRMIVSNVLQFMFNNSNTGLVVEGRDMGSVVFKNADLKIYLDASEVTRSERRIAQSGNKESVKDLRARDSRDINRKISPLIIPDDAIVINNENKSIDEVIQIIKENLKLQ